jgi:hypothetical protein
MSKQSDEAGNKRLSQTKGTRTREQGSEGDGAGRPARASCQVASTPSDLRRQTETRDRPKMSHRTRRQRRSRQHHPGLPVRVNRAVLRVEAARVRRALSKLQKHKCHHSVSRLANIHQVNRQGNQRNACKCGQPAQHNRSADTQDEEARSRADRERTNARQRMSTHDVGFVPGELFRRQSDQRQAKSTLTKQAAPQRRRESPCERV